MKFETPAQAILDFDLEARPLGWYGGDFVHKEVTAIAWAWINDLGPPVVEVRNMTRAKGSQRQMLQAFARAYARADIVVGHWIRGFDLPILQAAMVDNDLPLLDEKLTQDTKSDLIRLGGISKSQENLASYLGIESPKISMSMQDWREANRLTKKGLALVQERCIADVKQNIEMYRALLERDLLGPPKLWIPGTSVTGDYAP